jgi:hypothetical protein
MTELFVGYTPHSESLARLDSDELINDEIINAHA